MGPWATANYCRAGIKSLRGTIIVGTNFTHYHICRLRMFQLKKREKRMDVDAWVGSFLLTMGAIYDDDIVSI